MIGKNLRSDDRFVALGWVAAVNGRCKPGTTTISAALTSVNSSVWSVWEEAPPEHTRQGPPAARPGTTMAER